jgi:hypothetical protein
MFARDMRRAVELQGKNSEGIRAMIPRKGSILLPPDLMAPNSRADSTPDSPVLSEQQQRLICFRRGASGLVGLKLRKGERPSCGLFFIEDIVPGGAADVSSGFNVGDIVHAVNELQVCLENVLGVFRECASLLEFLVRLCTISTSASCCKIVRQFTPCSPPPPASVASVIV